MWRVQGGVGGSGGEGDFTAGESPPLSDARRYLREAMGIETDPPPALSVDSPQRFIRYGVAQASRLLKKAFLPPPVVQHDPTDSTQGGARTPAKQK